MTSKEWKICKFGNIIELIGGGTPKTSIPEYWNGNIPWISVKDFNNDNKKVYVTEKTITELGLNKSATKLLQKGDIIISARGTVGEIAVISRPMAFNQSCYGIKAIPNIVQDDFLYYLLKNSIQYLKHNTHGSVFDTITKETFEKIDILLPPLETQEKIARVLSSLDDKIELNNKINQNLEQQAQAIFKSWFVDFEPFGGKMPDDWSLKTLSDISNITAGGDKPDIVSNIETKECKIPIYSNGIDNNGLYGYTTEPKILQESVTVSARGTIGFTCLRLHPYVPIVRLISLIPRTDIVSAKYLYFSLLNKHITGTGTTQQQLTVPYFKTTSIIVPTFDIVNQFTEIVNSFYKIIEKNICENKRLIQLRDTLLPKLISGEIDVDKVEV